MAGMRKLRIVSQILFFAAFIISYLLNAYPVAYSFDSEWFLRLNPLTGILTLLASRTAVLPLLYFSVGMIIITLVFGRVFCGFICPLGALIDFGDHYIFGKMRSPKRRPPLYLQRLKYVLLILIGVCAVFGAIFPLFMDPLSILTRVMTIVAYPFALVAGTDALSLIQKTGLESFATATISVPLYYAAGATVLLAAAVFAGGFIDKRFWCQYICPSGAFFGLLSRWAPFKRHVDSAVCNECSRCRNVCPTRAIAEKNFARTSAAECIVCGACVGIKSPGCGSFGFGGRGKAEIAGADIKRRHLFTGLLGGIAVAPLFRADAMIRHDMTGRLIRPPGAVPEDLFRGRCIACGQCMKACPTNAIQPCGLTDGFSRMYTPKIVPRIGGCEEKCFLCGRVCPTQAIRPLTYDDKSFAKIGTAVINRHRCLAWEQNKECLVCDEVCPYNAIEMKMVQTDKELFKVPIVYEDVCMGCGMCEQRCPIFDEAAIIVYRFGENRRASGPYANEWQKQAMRERRKKSDAGALESGPSAAPGEGVMPVDTSKSGLGNALPPGFVQ